jgi:hypothetical protein
VELEIFRDAWKPFLASNSDRVPRTMNIGQTSEEILHDLMLKDRVRKNDTIERTLQFGTSVKFVRDNDDVLARDGGDEDAAVLKTEVALQAMKNALNTRGINVKDLTYKEIEDEKQRIAKEQALKFRKGGVSRTERHRMKKERALKSTEARKLLNPLQKRRLQLMKTFLNGYNASSPKKRNTRGQSNFEKMLGHGGGGGGGGADDEEEEEEEEEVAAGNGRNIEPLRPATVSAIFLPKRISPSKMTRGSRASLLPLGLTRLGSRQMLKGSTILLPFEKLALEEHKSKEQILAEKLEALMKAGDQDGEEDNNAVVTAVVPANLLPPPVEKKIKVKNAFGEEEVEEEENNLVKKKKDRSTRSMYHGFAPGFKPMTQPWRQTVFSMELPRVKGVRGNGAYQF